MRPAPPTIGDEQLYAAAGPRTLGAWDFDRGEVNWSQAGLSATIRAIAVTEETVYVSTDAAFFALGTTDGSVRWSTPISTVSTDTMADPLLSGFGPCTVTEDRIFVTANEHLVALTRDDGSIRWQVEFEDLVRGDVVNSGDPGAPAVAGGGLYTLTEGGRVVALQT